MGAVDGGGRGYRLGIELILSRLEEVGEFSSDASLASSDFGGVGGNSSRVFDRRVTGLDMLISGFGHSRGVDSVDIVKDRMRVFQIRIKTDKRS